VVTIHRGQASHPTGTQKCVEAHPGPDASNRRERTMGATSDKVQGHAKEVAGIVTDNEDLEAEGKADRQVGEAEQKVDDVKDRVTDLVDTVKDKVEDVADKAKDMLHDK
jgi:uncharacterized protein YjbJ (UPF0337 family)